MLKRLAPSPLRVFAGLLLAAALTSSTQALVVLTIDISNPADVVLKASTNLSIGNASLTTLEGFTIEDFFRSAQDITSATIPTGDLGPIGQLVKYDAIQTFDFSANTGNFSSGNDVTIYALTTGPEVFTTSTAPFTGTMRVDLSSHASALPLLNTTGNLYAGYLQSGASGQGVALGQWQVIPEPCSAILLGAGLIGFAARRRR